MASLKRRFERLCGDGSVHSCHVMVDGLAALDALCAQRDRARDALEDCRSKRAKLAADAEARLVRARARGRKRAIASTWASSKGRHPRFAFAPRDDRSSKNERHRVEHDRDTRL